MFFGKIISYAYYYNPSFIIKNTNIQIKCLDLGLKFMGIKQEIISDQTWTDKLKHYLNPHNKSIT